MNIRLVFAIFALTLPMISFASYSGSCGGDWTDADGYKGSCDCDQRPQCDDEGECSCEFDQYCADTSCESGVASIEPIVGHSSVRGWEPRSTQAEVAR